MPSIVVIGAQWGDEGKGKLVDALCAQAAMVVRFQGGNNAGHTLVVNGIKTRLSVMPSGILRPSVVCCIGAGVVVSTKSFVLECEGLHAAGVRVAPGRVIIDRDAQLILEYHIAIDQAREESLGTSKIGTTGRGIGPAYEDRAARVGVRVAELAELPNLLERMRPLLVEKNLYLKEVLRSNRQVCFESIEAELRLAAERLLPFVGNVSLVVDRALKAGERVVFEGAQGTLLDQTFGTVPFVTSSSTIAGAAATGTGIGPRRLDHVLAVVKAYATRVGAGPFPTELEDEVGAEIRRIGAEFGTVTGRPRRCGWFDAVAVRRALRLNGADAVALTKLDVLTGFEKIRVCVNYRRGDDKLEDVPALLSEFKDLAPEYVDFEGWREDLSNVTKWHELPVAARFYVTTLAEIIGVPIHMVGVGAERDATVFSSAATFELQFMGR